MLLLGCKVFVIMFNVVDLLVLLMFSRLSILL